MFDPLMTLNTSDSHSDVIRLTQIASCKGSFILEYSQGLSEFRITQKAKDGFWLLIPAGQNRGGSWPT